MPLADSSIVLPLLRCPRCASRLDADFVCTDPACERASREPIVVAGQPVLVDDRDSIVDSSAVSFAPEKAAGVFARLASSLAPKNAVAPRISHALVRAAASIARDRRARILVIGGGTIGSGLEKFYAHPDVDIVGFDVFASRFTHFVADAHAIPMADASVDGVIVQAVLEHVLDPARVVAEIHRVLRPHRLVYADTPFLQHVHEGPFDFTRFTESGHRYLFRWFERIESGAVAGVGTELSWSIAQAARSLVPLRGVAGLTRLLLTPLAVAIDRFARADHSLDGASSVYFYGSRSEKSISPKEMIAHYQGAQSKPSRAT